MILQQRLAEFDSVTNLWFRESSRVEGQKIWSTDYNDSHSLRKIIKIDSQQLALDAKSQKNPSRYTNIVPNFEIANCNHWADGTAEVAMRENISDIANFQSTVLYRINIPC